MKSFDIQEYMSGGIARIVKRTLAATVKNPRESAFVVKYAAASAKASARRRLLEEQGTHVPPFLIASITSRCNLHCKGCYSRENHGVEDCAPKNQLTAGEWGRIFGEAKDLGIGFILLAGGEPMLRRDVLDAAAGVPEIVFPVFTNGVFITPQDFARFDAHRNLIPVLSIEGDKAHTDARRGDGIYDRQMQNMAQMQETGLFFGASVTVTKENLELVMSEDFVRGLAQTGCGLVIYVEYVPVSAGSEGLAPDDNDRRHMAARLESLRSKLPDMLFLSFPGDEHLTGGCLAAGRGFFHISSHGDAEPCPFSPYSDTNIRDCTLLEALQSGLFRRLQDSGVLLQDHQGGCVLFAQEQFVRENAGK